MRWNMRRPLVETFSHFKEKVPDVEANITVVPILIKLELPNNQCRNPKSIWYSETSWLLEILTILKYFRNSKIILQGSTYQELLILATQYHVNVQLFHLLSGEIIANKVMTCRLEVTQLQQHDTWKQWVLFKEYFNYRFLRVWLLTILLLWQNTMTKST